MLPRRQRLTRGVDYRNVVRRGQRCAGTHTVVSVMRTGEAREPRFGFIVGRAVGTAVVRNTVRRRLKAVCAHEVGSVREGTDVVIRALPSAAGTDYAALHDEVSRCLEWRAR